MNRHSIPIGRPISNTQCFILDRRLQPVPIGVRGELFTGGDGLAHGYVNDSSLTAEKFIQNPFRLGALLYRTGDFARYLSDGNIEFLGRVDNQVKMRGFRIELGEVESVLTLHPEVRESAVAMLEDASGDKMLVAYVSPANLAIKVDELQSFLKERLPTYMLPSSFVCLDTLPLTANGKLDRKALPRPAGRSLETDQSYVAPRTATEEALAGMWREVFGVRQVGVRDNFFELGGHSLMVVRLIDRVNQTLNVSLGISELFQNPTVEQMAKLIDEQRSTIKVSRTKYPAGVVEIRAGTTDRPVFYLPGLGCTAFEFRGPSAKMDTCRPILGIELHDLELGPSVLSSIEYTARAVVQCMRQVQPFGPYIVVGYSFGGNLAVEVARQLTANDQSCELVVILDAYAIRPKAPSKLAFHLQNIGRLSLRESYAYITSLIRRRLFRQSQNPSDGAPAPLFPKDAIERRIAEISSACLKALHAHRPKVFSGRIVLLKATDLFDWMQDADPSDTCGWGELCKEGVEIIPMTCGHLDIFKEPNVTVLAGHINGLLNAIDSRAADRVIE